MGKFAEIDLFNCFPPSIHGSKTSFAAAVSIVANTNNMHQRIINFLKERPEGATDEQISISLDMKQSTQRPRRIELVNKGKVKDSGRKGKTSSNRSAVIWVLC